MPQSAYIVDEKLFDIDVLNRKPTPNSASESVGKTCSSQ